jgi:MFS superfamily sulfate permease-like transporter
MVAFSFRPKLLDTLKTYSREEFTADIVAGITVGIVALPLAMAFAIASGVKPEASLFTAIIASFLIPALGGTKVFIGGPTGAFFFGAVDKLESVLKHEKREPVVLILRMRKVLAMEATGFNTLEDLYERLQRKGKHLVLSGPHRQPLFLMKKAGFLDRIGRDSVCPHLEAVLGRARVMLGLPPAVSTDPLHQERQKLETVRQELASAIERIDGVLKFPGDGNGNGAPKS